MFYAGIILAPTIHADALSDLSDLRDIINTAASRIGGPTNSTGGWGFLSQNQSNPVESLGTAEIVTNITTTVLRANYNLGTNQTKWIEVRVDGNNSTRPPVNLTETGIDDPYIDYVRSVPNLSTALVTLGRSWHREMNRPIYDAIDDLQQTINTFSSSLLSAGLIHSNSTLRTIRASGTLEDAQVSWGRILNLPGSFRAAFSGPAPRILRRGAPLEEPWDGTTATNPPSTSESDAPSRGSEAEAKAEDSAPAATVVEITFEAANAELHKYNADTGANAKRSKRMLNRPHPTPRPGHRETFTHKALWGRQSRGASRYDGDVALSQEAYASQPYDGERAKARALPFEG